jgi:hypothetical protein
MRPVRAEGAATEKLRFWQRPDRSRFPVNACNKDLEVRYVILTGVVKDIWQELIQSKRTAVPSAWREVDIIPGVIGPARPAEAEEFPAGNSAGNSACARSSPLLGSPPVTLPFVPRLVPTRGC